MLPKREGDETRTTVKETWLRGDQQLTSFFWVTVTPMVLKIWHGIHFDPDFHILSCFSSKTTALKSDAHIVSNPIDVSPVRLLLVRTMKNLANLRLCGSWNGPLVNVSRASRWKSKLAVICSAEVDGMLMKFSFFLIEDCVNMHKLRKSLQVSTRFFTSTCLHCILFVYRNPFSFKSINDLPERCINRVTLTFRLRSNF